MAKYQQQHHRRPEKAQQAIEPIPSPYLFVPLSETVFFPDQESWASKVSMDVPFRDGISGTFSIKVTTKTPIYIRNGGVHPEGRARLDDPSYLDFFRVYPGGPYAIPGSSIKGLIRATTEIAAFGKIGGSKSAPKVSNHRYAVRDLRNPALYGDHITETVGGAYKPKVRAGWLQQDAGGESWRVNFCDFARVEQTDLESYFKVRLGERGPAKQKYARIPPGTTVRFDAGPVEPHDHSRGKKLIYRDVRNLGAGLTNGTIVLTGQPSPRNGDPGRKHMEFIFFNEQPTAEPVPESVCKDFVFAHSDLGENRKPNAEWAFWKPMLERGEKVPVFVLMKEDEPTEISSMGLAMMFRLPYKHSIHDAIENTGSGIHLDGSRLDLADLIFGRVEKDDGLRGRVSFETLVAEGTPEPNADPVVTVLNGPKPTYYPNYIDQQSERLGLKQNYRTFMDRDCRLRGWKRYIVGSEDKVRPPTRPPLDRNGHQNLDVATAFRPLPVDTIFKGDVHIHNLRPQELGALLWTIEWGGKNNLRHLIGMAKPFGFGAITIEIEGLENLSWCDPGRTDAIEIESMRKEFISLMESFVADWEKSDQIRSLKNIADPNVEWPHDIRYPSLGSGPRDNEFNIHKDSKNVLCSPLDAKRQAQKTTAATNPKPVEKTATELFLDDIRQNRLSAKELIKRLKQLNASTMPPDIKNQILAAVKKHSAAGNWNVKQEIQRWAN